VLLGSLAPVAAGQSVASATTGTPAAHRATAQPTFPATGYFSVAKTSKGRWYLVTPQGQPFYSTAVATVTTNGDVDRATGQCPYCQTVASNYPSKAAWDSATLARLRSWGFNTLGAFSDIGSLGSQMPYEVQLSMGNGSAANVTDWFAPAFATHADQVAAAQVAPLANDPNLIGFFTDAELAWGPPSGYGLGTILDHYLGLPAGSPGLAVAQQYVGNPSGFVFALATHYFQVTSAAIRTYDTHHLNLGVKAEGQEIQPELLEAARPYVDVFSVEDYTLVNSFQVNKIWPYYLPVQPNLANFEKYVQRPIMIGEYTSLAANPATPNTIPGIYAVAPTQQARAAAYAGFIAPLYENSPWLVGDSWFEYVDEPQGGRTSNGEDNNFGVVNVQDQPYPEMVNALSIMHSIAPDRLVQSGPTCDSWANGPNGVTCTAYMPVASYPLSIVDTSVPSGTEKQSYTGGVYAGGGRPAYAVSVTQGSLPPGLKLDRKTGTISGKPKAVGTFGFTVQVTDSSGSPPATQPLSISIAPANPVSIKTFSLTRAVKNAPYSKALGATGGTAPFTWSVVGGALPTGLSLGTDGRFSGQASVSGTFGFTVQVTDSSQPAGTASRNFTLLVK
jgi:hypothetical protein